MSKIFAIMLVLAPLLATATDRPSIPDAPSNLEISVRAGHATGTFQVHAAVSNRHTGKVVAVPDMLIRAGTWGTAEFGGTGAPETGSGTLAVTVDPSGKHAAYFAEFRQGGGNVDTQAGTMRVSK